MYRWVRNSSLHSTTKNITLTVVSGEAWINELAFFDTEGNLLHVTVNDASAAALVDEQDCVPEYPSISMSSTMHEPHMNICIILVSTRFRILRSEK